MYSVWMKCPTTGKDFDTGVRLSEWPVKGHGSSAGKAQKCPHCGSEEHSWDSWDAHPGPPDHSPER